MSYLILSVPILSGLRVLHCILIWLDSSYAPGVYGVIRASWEVDLGIVTFALGGGSVTVTYPPSCNSFTQVYNRYITYWSCLKLNMHRGSMGWIVDLVHHDMWCDFGSWDMNHQNMSHLILSVPTLSGLKALHCILIWPNGSYAPGVYGVIRASWEVDLGVVPNANGRGHVSPRPSPFCNSFTQV